MVKQTIETIVHQIQYIAHLSSNRRSLHLPNITLKLLQNYQLNQTSAFSYIYIFLTVNNRRLTKQSKTRLKTILGYPGVIPLPTSTPGTISWISFDVPLNEYYHFIGCIVIFGWARWPMKTILTRERLSDWTARYNALYRFSVADPKLF